ncbi:MAG: rod shape-determining protein RodA [Thermoleophilia bacterium]
MVEYLGQRPLRRRATPPEAQAASVAGRIDWVLMIAVVALVGFGLWAIEGITRHDIPGDPSYYLVRQGIFAAIGLGLMVVVLAIDPRWYLRWKAGVYGVMLGLMALVFVAGEVARGSRRWIDLSFFRFQPAELGKVLFVLFVAAFLADRAKRVEEATTPLAAVALSLPPIVLIFAQPDIGTALVYVAALGACLLVSGARWLHLAILGAVGVLLATAVFWLLPSLGLQVLKPYQVARLTGFTNPDEDPQGSTYNVRQSITAVGAGGFDGLGVEGATQTSLDYLPEHATDFAFASLAEQRGFVGAASLLLLYLLVVWRGLKIVVRASDAFSAVAAAGIVLAFAFQVFVNVGMTIGVAPVTGITLPFVSVGGSSLVSNLVAMGVLQAIHMRGRGARR